MVLVHVFTCTSDNVEIQLFSLKIEILMIHDFLITLPGNN